MMVVSVSEEHRSMNLCCERTDGGRVPLKLAASTVVAAVDVGSIGDVRPPSLSPTWECVLALALGLELASVPPSGDRRCAKAGSCDANDGGRSE